MSSEPVLDRVADAILDGLPLDWSTIESQVDADETCDRALVEQLKTLESLRRIRQNRAVPEPSGTWIWGHLQVFERIGHGAYGDVYRAWDTRLDREVALKLLPSDVKEDETSRSTVIEEGRLLARVRHPNVVTIHGAERIEGRVGLWMEFVKGRTLEEALRSGRKFTATEVTKLGVELCHAVSAVHAAGLLHRDIKAQNIMLDDSGRVVLMDFGAGRDLEATDKHIAGTPLYLAPEVLSGAAATEQSDVYSIGVVLFRLLTNAYPVSGGDLADLRRAHAARRDAGARLNHLGIPRRHQRVLARALDPVPERRHAGAAALATDLSATERPPALKFVIYVTAVAAAVIVAVAIGWNFGLRERLSPTLVAMGLLAKTPTIAVLPFRNMGSDPGNDQFIDGLTFEVIRNLSNLDGLQVIQPNSSFHYKDRADRLDAGKQLQADYVLEAGVQRVANRLRINPQLVRVADRVVVWSDQLYDRAIDDIFAIQDDISQQISNKLRLTLGQGQRRYQTNVSAYDLYLRGRAVVSQPSADHENGREAVKIFEQVIEMDHTFAPAHAGLAEAYALWSWQLTGLPPEDGLAAMRPAAERALYLDPLLPEAHAAMGMVYARELDWVNARKSFEHALRLRPYQSHIPAAYSFTTLLPLGRAREAERLLTLAAVRDPLSLAVRLELGTAQYYGGRYADAVENLQHVFDGSPEQESTGTILSRALTKAGRPGDAIKVFESRAGNKGWERWLAPAYVMAGRWDDVERLKEANKGEAPHRQLIIYAAIGDKEQAFGILGAAIDAIPHRMPFILASPDMDLLREDPRFKDFKARLNLR